MSCSPYMFRSKRSSLVTRLCKKRISQTSSIDSSHEESRRQLEPIDVIDIQLKTSAQLMLKRLKENQLRALIRAIDSKGGEVSDCVLVPKDDIKVGKRVAIGPHVLCCQMWRWPHLRHCNDIKPLHWCNSSTTDPIYVCINPYHWTQICKTDTSPPPYYSLYAHGLRPSLSDTLPVIDPNHCQQLSTVEQTMAPQLSTETVGSLQYGFNSHYLTGIQASEVGTITEGGPSQWCTLVYWELRNRVGRLFPVHSNDINVFAHLPQGEGLWLQPLFPVSNSSKEESVVRTRDKIGFGLSISRDNDGVWVYNRSNHAIFVNSPTLDLPNTRNLTVFKVLPGFSIRVFDYEIARNHRRFQINETIDGPMDPNAFRISFAKGWGPGYSRQFITCCECWLEVLLNVTNR